VRLDVEGNVDYSRVKSKGLIRQLKTKEELVRVTLMQDDLEFEYPHKLEKIAVKADVMKMIEEEEDKLRFIGQVDHTANTPLTDEEILASGNFVSYEKYYSEVEVTNAAID